MMCKLRCVFLIAFLSIYFSAITQNLKFDNYTSKDGLVSDEVYKIFQDRKGYMWFFTNYGTMKYNGKKFEQVLKNLPFKESFIYSYFENDKGQIWIANSNAKIYEVRNDSAFIVKGTEDVTELLNLKASEISALYVDKELNIYVSSKYNGYKLVKNKGYKALSLSKQPDADSVFVYALDIEGHIFNSISYSFRNQLNYLKTDSFTFRYINEAKPSETYKLKFAGWNRSLTPIYFKRFKNDIFFLYYDKLLRIQPRRAIKVIPFQSFVLNYTQDKNDHLWVGVLNGGLYELDKNDSIVNHYFGNETINHVFVDSQDGLWVSTEGSGIFHCGNLQELHFKDSEIFDCGISFIKKIDDRLFIATRRGNIYMIENDRLISIEEKNDNKGLLDIIKYHSDYIVYSRKQLDLIQIKDKPAVSKLPTIMPGFLPLHMLKLKGDTLLCFSRNRFLIINNGVESIRNNEMNGNGYLDRRIFSCAVRNTEKLVGTNDGVYLLNKTTLIQSGFLFQTSGCKIVNITEDNAGNFWFCTEGYGLFKLFSSNKLIHYTSTNGLPSDIVNNISFEKDGRMLLSTNQGLFESRNLEKWTKMYNGQVRSAYEYHGKIYLTAENKFVAIDKSKLANNSTVHFNLASVSLNGVKTPLKKILLLEHDQNNLTFDFDLISFSSAVPDIIYNLKGDKNNWIRTTDQSLVFQNLSPGEYVLTVGIASTKIKFKPFVIPFTIGKAFWQTSWFIALYILVGMSIVILIGWRVFKFYKARERKKSEVQQQISEYKLIALKAQINPHFMSNCLTAIQHLIFNNKVDEANEYLAKFSLLVRQVLNFSSKPLVSLREELEIVSINIELEQLRFENKFSYHIHYDKSLDVQSVFVPPLILQPIVENAIWHGLLPLKKTRKGELNITIHVSIDILSIVIEDNGVGRKIMDREIGNLKESKGIDITKQRLVNLNGYDNKDIANLIYDDLIDSAGVAIGTKVTVVLPLNLKKYSL
ncbi:MAG: histidine kinase [Bacteroidota bacterium]